MRARVAVALARTAWRSGLLALVVGVLLVVAGQRAWVWNDQRQRDADHSAVVAAATAEVEGLIGVSGATSDEDLEQLLDGATAGFRSELAAQADGLRKALLENKVTATGDVVSAGVVRLESRRATVIVAATGTVRNTATPEAQPRNYRLRVDLELTGKRWLVSGLEFVA